MIKLAIALSMTLAAAAVALSPVSAAVASIFELFIVLGAFVVSVASVRAVTAAPF